MIEPRDASWTAARAWLCTLVLFLFPIVIYSSALIPYPQLKDVKVTPVGFFWWTVLIGVCQVAVTLAFARSKSVYSFARQFALSTPPTIFGWCAAMIAVVLAVVGLHIAQLGMVGESKLDAAFSRASGEELVYFWLLIMIAPPFEEIIVRGYLYPAFRKSYGIGSSIAIILLIDAATHWRAMSASWTSLLLMSTVGAGLCYVRERTGNLWNCICCHLAYNLTLDLGWKPVFVALMFAISLSMWASRKKDHPA